MQIRRPAQQSEDRAIVVGAGIAGLTAALLLRASGMEVTLCERHAWVGGKLRSVASAAGPVDAGPTVLTLRRVLDDVFAATGASLDAYAALEREPCLARHHWPDGGCLDLWDDPDRNAEAIARFAGSDAARQFRALDADASALFDLFDAPMMQAAEPNLAAIGWRVAGAPRHLGSVLPGRTLADTLARRLSDPRLRQLFGRYATYVGGMPDAVPALLLLVWQAEARGIWRVRGGLAGLAAAMATRFREMGGTLRLGTDVAAIERDARGVTGVRLADGAMLRAPVVVFNGDPRALATGLMGPPARDVAPRAGRAPRSLSARVWSFAATLGTGPALAHHNVFFARDPAEEFRAIAAGRASRDPTLYLCAQDRGTGIAPAPGPERFEIILNAAPLTASAAPEDEVKTCRQTTFETLRRFGLQFDPPPPDSALTTPRDFERMFPGSAGALYGTSPEGALSSLRRPRARTSLPGLYLAGGGTHPGPGLPMAALSGRHAAEAIATDRASTSTSRRAAMPGGMSTGSAPTAPGRSRSSPS